MLLGYNTNGFAHHRLEDALDVLAHLGFQSVAITLDHHALNPYTPTIARDCADVRGVLERANLAAVVETGARFLLNPYKKHWPTLLAGEKHHRELRWDFLWRSIDVCQLIGARAVSLWSGMADPEASEDACWRRLLDACRWLADRAATAGVRIAFEPEPGMFIDTMPKFAELHRRVDHPHFGLTLDVGHLHCMDETPIALHIERWKDWLWNVHIEDMRRGVHDHLMFGEGDMEFPPILRALTSIGYDGGVHVELSRHSHDAVNTARKAFEFLRRSGFPA
ncbi:MAG TPA: sugar phosphate isomerase/epimerase family protein [Gemmataceae bacterium]|nr:sugar phosphate isomerase/epimerase family protein [Gemmataceae bacterium]